MELIKLHQGDSRLKISITVQNEAGHTVDIPCLIDTGCSTTMIDIDLATRCGEKLEESLIVNLGNKQYVAQSYKLKSVLFGNLEINNVFALAVQFDMSNELRSGMLLGLNVLNNFEYCVNRNNYELRVKEDIFTNIPDKSYPYMHWFRGRETEYVKLQDKHT